MRPLHEIHQVSLRIEVNGFFVFILTRAFDNIMDPFP